MTSSIWSNSTTNGQGICEPDGKYNLVQKSVESIYIPEGIEEIGIGTFQHSEALKEVDIPSTVKTIVDMSFYRMHCIRKSKF